MIAWMHQPGFLGTSANLAADLTLIAMLLVAALLTYGFFLARRGRYEAHKWIQTAALLLNLVFVLWMMVLPYRDFVLRDQGGPRPGIFYLATHLHALLGLAALLFGNFVALRGHNLVPRRLRFKKYKPYMRAAYALYMLAILAGLWVYLTWFVFIPNPPVF
jgi:uncharacterized membrane protein YozB (DUF420 family)